jgi:PhnB protein
MSGHVKPVPDGYHTATPYLIVKNAIAAIDFYIRAFGATEIMRIDAPGGKIGHAEIRIGNSPIMLADEFPEMDCRSPEAFGGSPVSIHLYVDDADAMAARATAAGATLTRPVEDKFYGDRSGSLKDPFGHVWHVSTHMEDLDPAEIGRRAEAFMRGLNSP